MVEARALEAQGRQALAAGDPRQAATYFDRALAAIGTSYQKAGVVDDTGLKLTLSEAEARKANWAVAANLKANVVAARLAALDAR